MSKRSEEIDGFFNPASVAVAGASRASEKAGNTVVANILEFGYSGRVYPINPEAGEILGLTAYPDLSSLPERPDLVIAVLPRERTLGLVRECASLGVGHLIIPAAGFSDAGGEGRRMEEEVLAAAGDAGMRVMGPNSIGTVCTTCGLATSIVSLERMKPGGVALFGQTGLFSSGIARWVETSEAFGISKIACLGNKGDVDENDLLEYLGDDDRTGVIGVYTEGVKDGVRFARALKDVSRRKAVLLLKGGRTERGTRAVASHTGSMTGSAEIFAGLSAQAGAVQVADFEEMLDCARALAMQPLPSGPGVGIVSITGSGCVLSADFAGEYGLELPAPSDESLRRMHEVVPDWVPISNPADIWAVIEKRGAERAYSISAAALASQDDVHALMVVFTVIPESMMDVSGFFSALREGFPDKPVVSVFIGGDAAMHESWRREIEGVGVPCYPSPRRGLMALGAMWACSAARGRTQTGS